MYKLSFQKTSYSLRSEQFPRSCAWQKRNKNTSFGKNLCFFFSVISLLPRTSRFSASRLIRIRRVSLSAAAVSTVYRVFSATLVMEESRLITWATALSPFLFFFIVTTFGVASVRFHIAFHVFFVAPLVVENALRCRFNFFNATTQTPRNRTAQRFTDGNPFL